MVSSNQDANIANVIEDIYVKVGLKGAVSIHEGSGFTRDVTVEYVNGMSFDQGFLSPYFAQDREMIEFTGAGYICLVDGTIETEHDVVRMLEFAKKTGKPLIIVAQEFSSQALTAMVVNKL